MYFGTVSVLLIVIAGPKCSIPRPPSIRGNKNNNNQIQSKCNHLIYFYICFMQDHVYLFIQPQRKKAPYLQIPEAPYLQKKSPIPPDSRRPAPA